MKQKVAIIVLFVLSGIFRTGNAQWIPAGLQGNTPIYCITRLGQILFAGTNSGLFFTTDNGISWQPNSGFGKNSVISFATLGQKFFAGTDSGGILVSSDSGLNWTSLIGMSKSFPISGLQTIDSNIFASTIGAGIFRSTDKGQTWSPFNTGLHNFNIYSFAKFDSTLFVGSDTGRVYLSDDKGLHWIISDSGENNANFRPVVNAFAKKDSLLFSTRSQLSGGSSVFISTDRGRSWSSSGTFSFEHDKLTALLATDSGIFAGCFPTYYHSHSRLFRSTDNGVTWVNADDGYGGGTEYLTLLDSYIYACTLNGIWRRQLSDFHVYAGQINAPNIYFDDTMIGDTECKTLTIHNTGNNLFTLLSLTIDTVDKWSEDFSLDTSQFPIQIKAGDSLLIKICYHPHNLGLEYPQVIWKTDIPSDLEGLGKDYSVLYGTGVQNSAVSIIKNSEYLRLSPNPTTGIITLHNAPANILNITVSNILGESVLELAHPNAPEFTLDLSKLPPGTYFARFSLPNQVITRKIMKE